MEICKTQRKRDRGKQGEIRSQVAELLRSGFTPAEICSRLNIHERTFYYHVKGLRERGHIFPNLAARRGRPRKAEENILEAWLAVKEQAREEKLRKLLRMILMEAHRRGMIDFETCRNLTPHQYFEIRKYDWVTALNPVGLRTVKGLLSELERNGNAEEDMEAIVGKLSAEEFSSIVNALTAYDMVNLGENVRMVTNKLMDI